MATTARYDRYTVAITCCWVTVYFVGIGYLFAIIPIYSASWLIPYLP